MKATILLAGAAALACASSLASAQKTSPPGNGQFNGNNYWHQNSGNANGQPGASCEDLPDSARPGNSASAPGSAFNPDGNAGTKYAGEQPQNSRNTANSSQYDVACANQAAKL